MDMVRIRFTDMVRIRASVEFVVTQGFRGYF